MKNRRRMPRICPATELLARINGIVEARVIDMSPLGVQLEALLPLRPASRCSVSLAAAGGTLRLRARVQRCRATAVVSQAGERHVVYRAGLEFVDLNEQEVLALYATQAAAAAVRAEAS